MNGETIIYFGPEPWEGMWRNRHQLMSRMAKKNYVYYVEPALSLRQAFAQLFSWPAEPRRTPGRGEPVHLRHRRARLLDGPAKTRRVPELWTRLGARFPPAQSPFASDPGRVAAIRAMAKGRSTAMLG